MAKAIIEIKDEFVFSFSKESRGSRDSREIPEFVRSFFIKNISSANIECVVLTEVVGLFNYLSI